MYKFNYKNIVIYVIGGTLIVFRCIAIGQIKKTEKEEAVEETIQEST